jgi:hypothetical protein
MRFSLGTTIAAESMANVPTALVPQVDYNWEAEQAARQKLEDSCAFYQVYNSCLPKNPAPGTMSTADCVGGCQTTPMSLLRAPGLVVGRALKKVFTSQDANQLEMVGHIATALVLIGGTVYLFNSRGR